MSDIDMNFPLWFTAGYFIVIGWYVSVPAIVVLVLAGFASDHFWRVAALVMAALLALPFVGAGVFTAIDHVQSARAQAAFAQTHRTLDRDETVVGLALPAGTEIDFIDATRSQIRLLALPRPTIIRSARVTGTLERTKEGVWTGELADDQTIHGWPCRAGAIDFDDDGSPLACKLAAEHQFLGLTLPSGTEISRDKNNALWSLQLPDEDGLAIPALATSAPPGIALRVTDNGRLEAMTSGNGAPIVVRGVPLNTMNLAVRGDHVIAALKEPFTVAGAMQPIDTGVDIDLTSGAIALAGKNWWLSP